MEARKEAVCNALYRWISQRPGLEYGNYGDAASYRAEVRSIGRDLQHARMLLRAVELRDTITAEDLLAAARSHYSGRLTIQLDDSGKATVDYCTGQYWPTEYRRAVCAVLAGALWAYWRDNLPAGELMHNSETGETLTRYKGLRAGDYLRQLGRKEFGRGIASRWFN